MTPDGKFLDRTTVRFERLLPGPIDRVWDHLTRAELLATWLADGDIPQQVGANVELSQQTERVAIRVGGLIYGKVMHFEAPHSLAYTWSHRQASEPLEEAPEADTLVEFELQPAGDNVRLTLTHSRMQPDIDVIPRVGAGWHTLLEFLDSRLAGREAPNFPRFFESMLPRYTEQVDALDE